MYRICTIVTILTTTLFAMHCSSKKEDQSSFKYPHPVPDSAALRFLPGIVCSDSLDFNAAFSPDGKRFYFARSRKGKWMFLMTEQQNGTWSKPKVAPFNEDEYSQADPFITPEGTVYYISNRPRNGQDTVPDYDIWFVRPQPDGSWSKPENLEIVNSDSTEYYVSLVTLNNRLRRSPRFSELPPSFDSSNPLSCNR